VPILQVDPWLGLTRSFTRAWNIPKLRTQRDHVRLDPSRAVRNIPRVPNRTGTWSSRAFTRATERDVPIGGRGVHRTVLVRRSERRDVPRGESPGQKGVGLDRGRRIMSLPTRPRGDA
jgi:hypothetical protein